MSGERAREDMEAAERRDFIWFCIRLIVITAIILLFVAFPSVVRGTSMCDTLENRDRLIIQRVTYYFRDPERFDIIVFRSTATSEKFLIKRVIGLPGETVSIHEGNVYINGELLAEDVYAKGHYTSAMEEIKLGEDEFFVLGDNRNASLDSRVFGPIKKSTIMGRELIRFWPFKRFGVVKGQPE